MSKSDSSPNSLTVSLPPDLLEKSYQIHTETGASLTQQIIFAGCNMLTILSYWDWGGFVAWGPLDTAGWTEKFHPQPLYTDNYSKLLVGKIESPPRSMIHQWQSVYRGLGVMRLRDYIVSSLSCMNHQYDAHRRGVGIKYIMNPGILIPQIPPR
jgi:hypothetical protein